MSRRHLPFCRLDNRTIYLGIHLLLPLEYCPGPYPALFIITTRTTSCRSTLPPMHGRYRKLRCPAARRPDLRQCPRVSQSGPGTRGPRLASPPAPSPLPSRDTHRGHTDGDGSPGRLAPSSRRVARRPGTAHDSSPGVGTEYGAQVGAVTVLWDLLPLGAGSWLISAVPSTAWCA